jgi:hypothetical protein
MFKKCISRFLVRYRSVTQRKPVTGVTFGDHQVHIEEDVNPQGERVPRTAP